MNVILKNNTVRLQSKGVLSMEVHEIFMQNNPTPPLTLDRKQKLPSTAANTTNQPLKSSSIPKSLTNPKPLKPSSNASKPRKIDKKQSKLNLKPNANLKVDGSLVDISSNNQSQKSIIKVKRDDEDIKESKNVVNVKQNEDPENQELADLLFEDEEMGSDRDPEGMVFDDEEPEKERRKVLKKRKVMKKERFLDGKYMKTRNVEVVEEYWSSEEVVVKEEKMEEKAGTSNSKPDVIPGKSKGKKKNDNMSIMNFFSKK